MVGCGLRMSAIVHMQVTIVQLAKEKMSLVNIAVASCYYCSLLHKAVVYLYTGNRKTDTGFECTQ